MIRRLVRIVTMDLVVTALATLVGACVVVVALTIFGYLAR